MRQEVRISTGKRFPVEASKRGSDPLAMPPLFYFVRVIDECGENLDQHMVAPKAEGRRLDRNPRGSTSELMGKDRAPRRHGRLHRVDKDVDTAASERRKPARLHEYPLAVDEEWIECGR